MHEVTIEIAPNEKYWRVIDPVERVHGEDTDYEDWSAEQKEAADSYLEVVDQATDAGYDAEFEEALSWDHFGVSKDPDLVAKMATYFEGMDPTEPTDRLRAKLRLLDCEVYASAQTAASAELRNT